MHGWSCSNRASETDVSSPIDTVDLDYVRPSRQEARERARALLVEMRRRRSVRAFSSDPVPREVLQDCVLTAAQAPSGANKQPWTFVIVTDAATKRRIRQAAEVEEQAFYGGRAPERWLHDLEPFGTDASKPFLEIAPALIVVFAQKHGDEPKDRHYYVAESIGIATGFLIAAIHRAGLVCLTHTPSPMRFLQDILRRPANERPFLLIPVGYPKPGCRVPAITRKAAEEVCVWHDASPLSPARDDA